MRQKKRFRRLVFFLCGLFVAYVFGCFAIADMIITRKRVPSIKPPQFSTWEPVPNVVSWTSPAVPEGNAKNLFIFAHGIKADRSFFANTATVLMKRGYDVVLLPMPGHDVNPDPHIGFGVTESKLIKQTIDAVKADHIVLVGCSMGGAGTWLASDHPRVHGVVTESAYGRFEPITHIWFNRVFTGGDILFRPSVWIASNKLGLNPSDINPVETAAKWDHKKPALVIHGPIDSLIPYAQGQELAKVSGAELWSPENREHGKCQDEGDAYIDHVESVMKRVLHTNR
ncbi:MAG: alpha/beta hydrolase [Armatimonadota bacterium]